MARSRAETGHQPAFSAVLEQHGPAVLRFCRGQVGVDRGDDVFQETMLSALRAYESVRDPRAIRSWLFSIAARKAIDLHRAAARGAIPIPDPEPPLSGAAAGAGWAGGGAGSAGDGESWTGDGEVWADVARLPEKQRQAVTLRFMADLSHREIGNAMNISEAAARRNVLEGLRRLRRELDPESEPERSVRCP